MQGKPNAPLLIDCKGIMKELGVTRHTAENIMRELELVRLGRRVYVHRKDVLRYVAEVTGK